MQDQKAPVILTIDGVSTELPFDEAGPIYVAARAEGRQATISNSSQSPTALVSLASPGSSVAMKRTRVSAQIMRRNGFAVSEATYALGARLGPRGDKKLDAMRIAAEAMPTLKDASEEIIEKIKNEHRRYNVVNLNSITMEDDGKIKGKKGSGAYLTHDAFYQLCARMGVARGARYLTEDVDTDIRQIAINRHLHSQSDTKIAKILTKKADSVDTEVSAYAVVGERYTNFDANRVIAEFAKEVGDAKAEIIYNPNTTDVAVTALWMPDSIQDYAVGDVFKAGVRIRTNDAGRGSVSVEAVLWRNLCLNLMIIDRSMVNFGSKRHMGSEDSVKEYIREATRAAKDSVADFLNMWKIARSTNVDVEVELLEIVPAGLSKLNVISKTTIEKTLVPALMMAYTKEPGSTAADMANAITRAAHEGNFSMDERTGMESFAYRYVAGVAKNPEKAASRSKK